MAAFAVSAFEMDGNSALSGELSNSLFKLVPVHELSHISVRGAMCLHLDTQWEVLTHMRVSRRHCERSEEIQRQQPSCFASGSPRPPGRPCDDGDVRQDFLHPVLVFAAEGQIEPKLEKRFRFLALGLCRLNDLNLLHSRGCHCFRCRWGRNRRLHGDFDCNHLHDGYFFHDNYFFDGGSFALSGR